MRAKEFGLRESDLKNITQYLKEFDNISEAILFGSRAKGNYKHGSDVDIALKGDIDFRTITRLSYLLNQESLMPYKFDIINYFYTCNKDLKDHINRVGMCIYQNSTANSGTISTLSI